MGCSDELDDTFDDMLATIRLILPTSSPALLPQINLLDELKGCRTFFYIKNMPDTAAMKLCRMVKLAKIRKFNFSAKKCIWPFYTDVHHALVRVFYVINIASRSGLKNK